MAWKPPLHKVYEAVANVLDNDDGLEPDEIVRGATMAEKAVKLFYETL